MVLTTAILVQNCLTLVIWRLAKHFYFFEAKKLINKIQLCQVYRRELVNFIQRFSSRRYDLYWQPNYIPSSSVRATK